MSRPGQGLAPPRGQMWSALSLELPSTPTKSPTASRGRNAGREHFLESEEAAMGEEKQGAEEGGEIKALRKSEEEARGATDLFGQGDYQLHSLVSAYYTCAPCWVLLQKHLCVVLQISRHHSRDPAWEASHLCPDTKWDSCASPTQTQTLEAPLGLGKVFKKVQA